LVSGDLVGERREHGIAGDDVVLGPLEAEEIIGDLA
jgi:hypothetical protein